MVLMNPPQIRSKSLDILRALAIFLVMGHHLGPCPKAYGIVAKVARYLTVGGWAGVDLFFVLSGFLISGLLFKEYQRFGEISFKRFFIRRAFKIYPAYYFTLILAYLLLFYKNPSVTFPMVISWLFFLQNYFYSKIMFFTWTLAVEEQFYIFLPVLLIILTRASPSRDNPFKSIPLIAAAIGLSCLAWRIGTYPYALDPKYFVLRLPFHLRLDSLFFGVLISYFYHYHPFAFRNIVRRFKYVLLILGAALFIPAFLYSENSFWIPTFEYSLLYLGSGCLILALVEHHFKPNAFTKALAAFGFYSYSIYLCHMPVRTFCMRFFSQHHLPHFNWGLYAIAYTLGSLVVGILMAKVVETPMLKWRDRLYPTRSKSPVGQHIPSV